MKRTLIILIAIIGFSTFLKAQNYYDTFNYYLNDDLFAWVPTYNDPFPNTNQYYNNDTACINNVLRANLKSFHYENQTLKKGEKIKLTKVDRSFSLTGKPLAYSSSVINQKKNKEHKGNRYSLAYTAANKIQEYAVYKYGNVLKYKTIYNYDSTNLLKQTTLYSGRKIKYTGRTTYEWFSPGKPKLIVHYKRKEYKPKITSFDCLPEGKNENTRKDTTTVCRNTEVDANGNHLEIDIIRNKKGKEFKTIKRFNKNNNMVAYEHYNSDGKYRSGWESTYNSNGDETSWISLGKNKKIKHTWEYTYNNKNQCVKVLQYNRKKKIKTTNIRTYEGKNLAENIFIKKEGNRKNQYSRTTYEYDSKSQLIKNATFNKFNVQRWARAYKYNEKGMYEKIENFNKKNEPINITTYTFVFNK